MSEEAVTALSQARTPYVSVVIPHYNDIARLQLCYASLLAQTWAQSDFEIVVADNNSSCGITVVRAAAPQAIVVPAPVQGAGPARNAGVAASSGQVLAFLDSDCIPHPNWIMEGVAALQQYDFIGGRVIIVPADPDRPTSVEAFECVFNFNFRRYIEKVGFTGTGNMFVPRTTYDRVGGFRGSVAEDMDWSLRARGLGYRIGYAERAVVGHPARQSWAELKRRWARMEAEHFLLAREQRFGRLLYVLKALGMPLSIIPHVGKVLGAKELPHAQARFRAIVILARLRVWRASRMLRLALGSNQLCTMEI